LFTHVASLAKNIRDLAVTLYFKPFSSIALDRMAAAFGWTTEQTEQQVVALIHAGRIQGRVDSQNKVLLAKKTDYRADLFSRAMKAGGDIQAANRKLLLRMRLWVLPPYVARPLSFFGTDLISSGNRLSL
jgi:COP9 signalosome complex subunit 1